MDSAELGMVTPQPYAGRAADEREDILQALMADFEQDWRDHLCRQSDGSMVWDVNACDVLLLVDEIHRLRLAAKQRT